MRKIVSVLAVLACAAFGSLFATSARAADCRPCAMKTSIAACMQCSQRVTGFSGIAWCQENQPICTGKTNKASKVTPGAGPKVPAAAKHGCPFGYDRCYAYVLKNNANNNRGAAAFCSRSCFGP